MMTETKIERRDPAELRLHRLQKHIPAPVKDSAEWNAFKDDLLATGPEGIAPLFITKDGQIMDGGWRWRAAKELQWDGINCIVRPEEDAAAIIVETLLHRKQMTRGAVVYLALSVLNEFIEAAERRRLHNLKTGKKTRETTLMPSNSASGNIGVLCEKWGVSRDTFERARTVRALLHDDSCRALAELCKKTNSKVPGPAELGELQAKLRAEFEPALLCGEKNLWNVVSGIAGKLPGNQAHREQGVQAAQLDLFTDGFAALRENAPKAWNRLGEEKRESVIEEWRKTAKALPAELRQQMKAVLDELS